jgi:transposase
MSASTTRSEPQARNRLRPLAPLEELIEDRHELVAAVRPLLEARKAIEQQVDDLDRKVLKLGRYDAQVRRFMTAPGVGPITALCFKATIDDPTRFKRSRSVGAYVGLTTRRYASGEVDWSGRISKCGDAMLRTYLFEAANVLLTRVPKWSTLKAWGIRLAKRNGLRKAKVRCRSQARGHSAPHVGRWD